MRIDRQQVFSGTMAADLSLPELASYLTSHIDGFAGPLTAERFKGGQSNPTYKLSTPKGSYVLRRKPFGKLLPSAHAIEREYRVTLALAEAGFPVARPLHLCTDDGVIGAAFYAMEHAEGRVFWEPHAPGISLVLASSIVIVRTTARASAPTGRHTDANLKTYYK